MGVFVTILPYIFICLNVYYWLHVYTNICKCVECDVLRTWVCLLPYYHTYSYECEVWNFTFSCFVQVYKTYSQTLYISKNKIYK